MIKVFANKMMGTEPELKPVSHKMTLLEWFWQDGLPRKADLGSLPITVWRDGHTQILPNLWKHYVISPDDDIEIYREPKGTDPFSITFALIFGAQAVLSALMPKIPGIQNGGSGGGSGDALDEASTKGNRVKLNDVIPELFGFNRRYPDYANPPRRYFTGPREQWIEMLLVVGPGEYQIPLGAIKTGETPLASLGDDARFTVYPPGADLSNERTHRMWYSAPEVGAGSTGTAGLEMTASYSLTAAATASVFQFNSNTVSIPSGAGSFPADWSAGLLIGIGDTYTYTVTDGSGTGGRDVISGGNVANLGFAIGDLIEIQGANAGLYEVFSLSSTQLQLNYAGGAAATGLVGGNVVMAIGYRGLRYRIVSFSTSALIVERLKTDNTTDTTWPGWVSNSSNSAKVQLDSSNLTGGYRGPFPACPPNQLITAIEWDTFYPSGLVYVNDQGDYLSITGAHVMEWRDMAISGAWTAVGKGEVNNTLDSLGYTYQITLPYPMRAEVRMRKQPVAGATGNNRMDKIQWYGLRGYIPSMSPTRYEGLTMIGVAVRGGDRIASSTESLVNMECTRILPVLNGSGQWGPAVPTRQISAAVGYIAKSVGYEDADLDMAELQRLENIWTARGDWYDKIVTDQTTVKGAIIEVLQAGFAELTIDRGLIKPVRDEPRGDVFNHIYDPMNMLEPLTREASHRTPDDFDGVDVEYLDATTWAKETVTCRLPGDLGTRVEQIKIDGVINRTRAWRIGMRRRRTQVYRKKQFSFSTELDALNSSYLDYALLGDSVIGYGQSAYMTGFQDNGAGSYYVGSSEPFDWSAGGDFKLSIRRKDGSVAGPYDATRFDDYTLLIDKEAFDSDPRTFVPDLSGVQEPPFLRFGPADKWAYPALITAVNPSGTKNCKVEAVIYDERVYADDDNVPPEDS